MANSPTRVPLYARPASGLSYITKSPRLRHSFGGQGHGVKRVKAAGPWSLVGDDDSSLSEDEVVLTEDDKEHGNANSRVLLTLNYVTKLNGVVTGQSGGSMPSTIAGHGKGVPPSTRVEYIGVVPISTSDQRNEGVASMVLTGASDGVNLVWEIPVREEDVGKRKPRRYDDTSVWRHIGPLPFWSVCSRFRGATSGLGNRRRHSTGSSPKPGPAFKCSVEVAVQAAQQSNLKGAAAFVVILARLLSSPYAAFSALDANHSGGMSMSELEDVIKTGFRFDLEAATGKKIRELFAELDTRHAGLIALEDLGCSSSSEKKQLPCKCVAHGHRCISEVWQVFGDKEEERRIVEARNKKGGRPRTASPKQPSASRGHPSQAAPVNQARSLKARTPRPGTSSEEGPRPIRPLAHRVGETLRREAEARGTQDAHLDPERERFITTVSHTTVLHPLDFSATSRALGEIEAKQALVNRLNAEAEADFAKYRGGIRNSEDFGTGTDNIHSGRPKSLPGSPTKEKQSPSKNSSTEAQPNTPRALLDMVKKKMVKEESPAEASGGKAGGQGLQWLRELESPPDVPMLPPTPRLRRQQVALTCLASDEQNPRVAVGVGDGQIGVYFLHRAHGHRKKRLHQIQGFDASRRIGDVATALYFPNRKLEEDGSLAADVMIAGFESGRVAVFRTFYPDEIFRESAKSAGSSEETSMTDREYAQAISVGEPVLTLGEPLLLEHYHCNTPVIALFWHPIMGIFSIGSYGHVLVSDTFGNKTVSIMEACGRNAIVTSVDLSLELEQLACAGQRGVHIWQNLSQGKFGVISRYQSSTDGDNPRQSAPVILVKYMASMRWILTVHKDEGEVCLWDARSLELQTCIKTESTPYATSAFLDSRRHTLFVFGPSHVAELQVEEQVVSEAENPHGDKVEKKQQAIRKWKTWEPDKHFQEEEPHG